MRGNRLWLGLVVVVATATIAAGCRGQALPFVAPTAKRAAADEPIVASAPTPTPSPTSTPTPTATPEPTPTQAAKGAPESAGATSPIDFSFITSTLDSGWVLYELPEEGFSVELPPGWLPVDLSVDDLTAMLGAIGDHDAQMGGILSGEAMKEMMAEGMVFYALDLDRAALELGMPASVTVLEMETGIALPLDIVVPLTLGQLDRLALPEIPITNERVDVGGIEAEVIRYVGELPGMLGPSLPVAFIQFVIPVGGRLFVISLSAPLDIEADYEDALIQIGSSFRVLE